MEQLCWLSNSNLEDFSEHRCWTCQLYIPQQVTSNLCWLFTVRVVLPTSTYILFEVAIHVYEIVWTATLCIINHWPIKFCSNITVNPSLVKCSLFYMKIVEYFSTGMSLELQYHAWLVSWFVILFIVTSRNYLKR